jgi:hypothetical protein
MMVNVLTISIFSKMDKTLTFYPKIVKTSDPRLARECQKMAANWAKRGSHEATKKKSKIMDGKIMGEESGRGGVHPPSVSLRHRERLRSRLNRRIAPRIECCGMPEI